MSYNPGPPQDGWGNQPPNDQPSQENPGYQSPYSSVPFGQPLGFNQGFVQYPESSQAGLALGLGIGSLIAFCICGILTPFLGAAAWYFGFQERKSINNGRRDPTGWGSATTGMYMGIAGLVFSVLIIGAYAVFIVLLGVSETQNL